MIKVFYLKPTNRSRLYLRRFADGNCPLIQGDYSYHNHMVYIGDDTAKKSMGDTHPHNDTRWPTACKCGYKFKNKDTWQLFSQLIYKRHDTGEEMILKEAPVGACWNADWRAKGKTYPSFGIGEDGRCLYIKTLGGDWCPDERASNCTLPHDSTHKCWCRSGSPEEGNLHIDKVGVTCQAGAGSIMIGSYHGFCHNGYLTDC